MIIVCMYVHAFMYVSVCDQVCAYMRLVVDASFVRHLQCCPYQGCSSYVGSVCIMDRYFVMIDAFLVFQFCHPPMHTVQGTALDPVRTVAVRRHRCEEESCSLSFY